MERICYDPPSIKMILVVEDDNTVASRLSELLAQQAAYRVIFVSDCLTTLKFLHYCKPDLILLDERLLHSNDIELGPRLAMMKDLQDIPIFLIGADFLAAEGEFYEDALPVHRQKKNTTSTASSSTQEQIAPGLWPRLSPET